MKNLILAFVFVTSLFITSCNSDVSNNKATVTVNYYHNDTGIDDKGNMYSAHAVVYCGKDTSEVTNSKDGAVLSVTKGKILNATYMCLIPNSNPFKNGVYRDTTIYKTLLVTKDTTWNIN